jgi:hypothetical protein
MNANATTHIDRLNARVGNRWWERVWDVMLGATTDLVQKSDEFAWADKRSAEFAVTINGESLGIMDFPDLQCSEEHSPAGAMLAVRRSRPGLQLITRSTAFERLPVLLRSVFLANTGTEPIQIEQITTDILPLAHTPSEVTPHEMAHPHVDGSWNPTQRAVFIVRRNRSLLLGREEGARIGIQEGDSPECRVFVDGPLRLEPGATQRLPDSFLIPLSWPLEAYALRVFGDFIDARRALDTPKDTD